MDSVRLRVVQSNKKASSGTRPFVAVRGGFEPPEQFPVRQFSKLVV